MHSVHWKVDACIALILKFKLTNKHAFPAIILHFYDNLMVLCCNYNKLLYVYHSRYMFYSFNGLLNSCEEELRCLIVLTIGRNFLLNIKGDADNLSTLHETLKCQVFLCSYSICDWACEKCSHMIFAYFFKISSLITYYSIMLLQCNFQL